MIYQEYENQDKWLVGKIQHTSYKHTDGLQEFTKIKLQRYGKRRKNNFDYLSQFSSKLCDLMYLSMYLE